MGYYADFEFSLTIQPQNVVAAENICRRYHADWGDYQYDSTLRFCDLFNNMWGEDLAQEQKPVPLQALASGEARGKISISGYVNKKWRDWEESFLDELAPLIDEGGEIEVKGEDYDAPSVWVFNGVVRLQYDREPVRCDYLAELEAKAKRLEMAEELLAEHLRIRSLYTGGSDKFALAKRIAEFLEAKAPPALQALAEQAE